MCIKLKRQPTQYLRLIAFFKELSLFICVLILKKIIYQYIDMAGWKCQNVGFSNEIAKITNFICLLMVSLGKNH